MRLIASLQKQIKNIILKDNFKSDSLKKYKIYYYLKRYKRISQKNEGRSVVIEFYKFL